MAQELPTIRVISFKTEYKKDAKGENVAIDWVEYAPIHAITSTRVCERVHALKPPEFIKNDDEGMKMAFIRHRWGMIEPAYEAWKNDQEIPINGTPIGAWPNITTDQAQALKKQGIRTVEEVAAMTDTAIRGLPMPNARDLVGQAQDFLAASDQALVAQEMTNRDARITSLEEKLAASGEQLAAAMELLEEKAGKPKNKAVDKKAA